LRYWEVQFCLESSGSGVVAALMEKYQQLIE